MVKNPLYQLRRCKRRGLVHGSGRAAGVGNGNLLPYSCLGNSKDREAWQATIQGDAKSRTESTHAKKKKERERERKVGRRHSPEPKGGQSWQPRPQALPTRLQQQICLVMLRRMGREQPPSRSTRKHGPLASEITCWAGEVGEEILQGRVSSGVD